MVAPTKLFTDLGDCQINSCAGRSLVGGCSHLHCPHAEVTGATGCLDFTMGKDRKFCELGWDCIPECPHSWLSTDRKTCEEVKRAMWTEE